jgi:hypothetical protein
MTAEAAMGLTTKGKAIEGAERYYVHADEKEGQPGTYYCAACDCFESVSHFYGPDHNRIVDNDYVRYKQSLKGWKQVKKRGSRFRRPENPPNYYA